jgi:hypothetical protein
MTGKVRFEIAIMDSIGDLFPAVDGSKGQECYKHSFHFSQRSSGYYSMTRKHDSRGSLAFM